MNAEVDNIIFSIFCQFTNNFLKYTAFAWGFLQIEITTVREQVYINGMLHDLFIKYDRELFILGRLILRFQTYRVKIICCNTTILMVYHTDDNLLPPISLRPTYTVGDYLISIDLRLRNERYLGFNSKYSYNYVHTNFRKARFLTRMMDYDFEAVILKDRIVPFHITLHRPFEEAAIREL